MNKMQPSTGGRGGTKDCKYRAGVSHSCKSRSVEKTALGRSSSSGIVRGIASRRERSDGDALTISPPPVHQKSVNNEVEGDDDDDDDYVGKQLESESTIVKLNNCGGTESSGQSVLRRLNVAGPGTKTSVRQDVFFVEQQTTGSGRPKRIATAKNTDEPTGLSWMEAKELSKALSASLHHRSTKPPHSLAAGETAPAHGSEDELDEQNDDLQRSSVLPRAQRKFASRGRSRPPRGGSSQNVVPSRKILAGKKAKTEDFLTFLCLRAPSSRRLPSLSDFLSGRPTISSTHPIPSFVSFVSCPSLAALAGDGSHEAYGINTALNDSTFYNHHQTHSEAHKDRNLLSVAELSSKPTRDVPIDSVVSTAVVPADSFVDGTHRSGAHDQNTGSQFDNLPVEMDDPVRNIEFDSESSFSPTAMPNGIDTTPSHSPMSSHEDPICQEQLRTSNSRNNQASATLDNLSTIYTVDSSAEMMQTETIIESHLLHGGLNKVTCSNNVLDSEPVNSTVVCELITSANTHHSAVKSTHESILTTDSPVTVSVVSTGSVGATRDTDEVVASCDMTCKELPKTLTEEVKLDSSPLINDDISLASTGAVSYATYTASDIGFLEANAALDVILSEENTTSDIISCEANDASNIVLLQANIASDVAIEQANTLPNIALSPKQRTLNTSSSQASTISPIDSVHCISQESSVVMSAAKSLTSTMSETNVVATNAMECGDTSLSSMHTENAGSTVLHAATYVTQDCNSSVPVNVNTLTLNATSHIVETDHGIEKVTEPASSQIHTQNAVKPPCSVNEHKNGHSRNSYLGNFLQYINGHRDESKINKKRKRVADIVDTRQSGTYDVVLYEKPWQENDVNATNQNKPQNTEKSLSDSELSSTISTSVGTVSMNCAERIGCAERVTHKDISQHSADIALSSVMSKSDILHLSASDSTMVPSSNMSSVSSCVQNCSISSLQTCDVANVPISDMLSAPKCTSNIINVSHLDKSADPGKAQIVIATMSNSTLQPSSTALEVTENSNSTTKEKPEISSLISPLAIPPALQLAVSSNAKRSQTMAAMESSTSHVRQIFPLSPSSVSNLVAGTESSPSTMSARLVSLTCTRETTVPQCSGATVAHAKEPLHHAIEPIKFYAIYGPSSSSGAQKGGGVICTPLILGTTTSSPHHSSQYNTFSSPTTNTLTILSNQNGSTMASLRHMTPCVTSVLELSSCRTDSISLAGRPENAITTVMSADEVGCNSVFSTIVDRTSTSGTAEYICNGLHSVTDHSPSSNTKEECAKITLSNATGFVPVEKDFGDVLKSGNHAQLPNTYSLPTVILTANDLIVNKSNDVISCDVEFRQHKASEILVVGESSQRDIETSTVANNVRLLEDKLMSQAQVSSGSPLVDTAELCRSSLSAADQYICANATSLTAEHIQLQDFSCTTLSGEVVPVVETLGILPITTCALSTGDLQQTVDAAVENLNSSDSTSTKCRSAFDDFRSILQQVARCSDNDNTGTVSPVVSKAPSCFTTPTEQLKFGEKRKTVSLLPANTTIQSSSVSPPAKRKRLLKVDSDASAEKSCATSLIRVPTSTSDRSVVVENTMAVNRDLRQRKTIVSSQSVPIVNTQEKRQPPRSHKRAPNARTNSLTFLGSSMKVISAPVCALPGKTTVPPSTGLTGQTSRAQPTGIQTVSISSQSNAKVPKRSKTSAQPPNERIAHLSAPPRPSAAPEYHPTEELCSDPFTYLRLIQPDACNAGMAHVIPASAFKMSSRLSFGDLKLIVESKYLHEIVLDSDQRLNGHVSHNVNTSTLTNGVNSVTSPTNGYKVRQTTVAELRRLSSLHVSEFFPSEVPTPDRVEIEYWWLAQKRDPTVIVDVTRPDANLRRSAFPTGTDDIASRNAWNFNIMRNHEENQLKHLGLGSELSSPRLEFSSLFTTRCWSRDRHSLPSIHYLHDGANVIWYSVAASGADQLISAMKHFVHHDDVTLDSSPSSSTDQSQKMISPIDLIGCGVQVFRTVQQCGEYIVLYPGTVAASIACGFNVCESLVFASTDWFSYGLVAAKVLREACTEDSFSISKVILSAALARTGSLRSRQMSLVHLQQIVEAELKGRKIVTDFGLSHSTEGHDETIRCDLCHNICFLSAVVSDEDDTVFCLHHAASSLGRRKLKSYELVYNYSQKYLLDLIARLRMSLVGGRQLEGSIIRDGRDNDNDRNL